MFRKKRKEKNTVPWSSGQDASLSRWNQGFDSPRHYQARARRKAGFFVWRGVGESNPKGQNSPVDCFGPSLQRGRQIARQDANSPRH